MSFISIPDNCSGHTFDFLSDTDKKRIKQISDLSLLNLMRDDKSEDMSLLVFPDDVSAIKDQFSNLKILNYNDGVLKTGNVMGFIGIGDTSIKIHSRFDKDNRDYFLHYLLQKVLQINLFDLPHSSSYEDIFDFLTMLFPYYLKKAMKQGLLRQYVTIKHNDTNFKGVLDINRHIMRNTPYNGKIAYNSRHFTSDNPIFHLIRLTINKIKKKKFGYSILNSDEETQKYIREIEKITSLSHDRLIGRILSQNLRSKIHPYYNEYESLRKLCIMILKNEEIKYGPEEEKIYGIIFDGSWLWEEYIGQVLSDSFIHYFKNKGKRFYLFKNDNKYFQQIIPDYISKDGTIVADAKYIPLEKNDSYNDERATSIYYKTITYMYRFNSLNGFLFFPYKGENQFCLRFNILSENSSVNGILTKLGLSIPSYSEITEYREFKSKMAQQEVKFLNFINKEMLS